LQWAVSQAEARQVAIAAGSTDVALEIGSLSARIATFAELAAPPVGGGRLVHSALPPPRFRAAACRASPIRP